MLHEREAIEWSNFWWENADKECKRILLVGDSVTRGYRSSLNNFFLGSGEYAVDLCAFSASVTDNLTEKMLDAFFTVSEYTYDYIGIQLGGQHGFKTRCCTNLGYREQYKNAYMKYIRKMRNICNNVFLISYTPTVLKEDLAVYNAERNKELLTRNEIVKEVADEMGCPYINLWDYILERNCKHTDYIHFDKEANQYIADYIGKVITE